ncbi:MAG: helix-turn-helix transcriptional regulator [Phycisphaerae bacterium]|nr:helix-turn-helix transcriptional regulator [Phycisphaerae bacterium]
MGHDEIFSAGGAKYQPVGYRFETKQYDTFQVIYVSWGELIFQSQKQLVKLTPGNLALLRHRSVFTLTCRRMAYRGVSFNAKGDFPAEFVGPAEALKATTEIQTLAKLMERQLHQPTRESVRLLEGLGRALAWETIRISEYTRAASRSEEDWAEIARQAMDVTLYSARTAREALKGVDLSYRQLCRHFQRALGCSPKQYQIRARLTEARRLLRETHLPITTIAMELGFCTSQHFATQFQIQTNQTPSDYRKQTQRGSKP